MTSKTIEESRVMMTELVLPSDTNVAGNLFGGKLMQWIDIAGALAASRHSRKMVATIEVDRLDFKHPVKVGEMVELHAKMTWVGRTSMEVKVCVCAENLKTGEKLLTNEAYLVYVALDDNHKPSEVPRLLLKTDEEKEEFEKAMMRKKRRMEMK